MYNEKHMDLFHYNDIEIIKHIWVFKRILNCVYTFSDYIGRYVSSSTLAFSVSNERFVLKFYIKHSQISSFFIIKFIHIMIDWLLLIHLNMIELLKKNKRKISIHILFPIDTTISNNDGPFLINSFKLYLTWNNIPYMILKISVKGFN